MDSSKQSHSGAIQGVTENSDQLTKLDTLDKDGVQTLLAYIQSKTVQEAADKLEITRQALWLRVKSGGDFGKNRS